MRKPGAFARYRFREQLFPTMHFRLTYDALREWRGDVEYVRILTWRCRRCNRPEERSWVYP